MQTSGLTAKGVPVQPKFMLPMKAAILMLSLAVLACSAISLAKFRWIGGAPGYMIFITVKTMIIYGGVYYVETNAPHMFYRIAIIGAYILNVIFWLSGWAWAANWASILCLGGFCADDGALAAAAALGALAWVISIVHLVFFVKACMTDPHSDIPAAPGAYNVSQAEQGKPTYPQQSYSSQQSFSTRA